MPAPLGPRRAWISPWPTLRETSATARCEPKLMRTPSSAIAAGPRCAADGTAARGAAPPVGRASARSPPSFRRMAGHDASVGRGRRRERPLPVRPAAVGALGGCPHRCRGRQESAELRPAARLGAVRHVELAVDVREVELHRLLGHPQPPRHLAVRVALGDELEDLALARASGRPSCPPRPDGHAGAAARDAACEEDRVLERLPNRRRTSSGCAVLSTYATRAGGERRLDLLGVVVHGEDDHAQAGVAFPRLAEERDPSTSPSFILIPVMGVGLTSSRRSRASVADVALATTSTPTRETTCSTVSSHSGCWSTRPSV